MIVIGDKRKKFLVEEYLRQIDSTFDSLLLIIIKIKVSSEIEDDSSKINILNYEGPMYLYDTNNDDGNIRFMLVEKNERFSTFYIIKEIVEKDIENMFIKLHVERHNNNMFDETLLSLEFIDNESFNDFINILNK